MRSPNNPGRTAGLWYLLVAVVGPFRLIYIPHALVVAASPATTAANLASHEVLFRLGMVSDLLCGTFALFLVLALYRLLHTVDEKQAVLMVILGGPIQTTLYFANMMNDAAALMFASGADFLAAFEKPQREALATLFLRVQHQEVLAMEIFWGLWLFPLASLVYRSRFLPRFLGIWLAINGLAYLVISFAGLLLPRSEEMISNALFPALFGELAIMLWLLIKGGNPANGDAASSSA